jgi:Protein of unknown function (DUF1698)
LGRLFSFEAERLGAKRVLATDSYSWDGGGWGTKKAFELAREALHSKVEDRTIDVMDLSPEGIGQFDVVLFLGVLYHLRHPLLALEKVFSVTGDMLILETVVDLTWTRYPVLRFYPGSQLAGDQTNWFGPNPSAVVSMLKVVGFRKVEIVSPSHHSFMARWAALFLSERAIALFGPHYRMIGWSSTPGGDSRLTRDSRRREESDQRAERRFPRCLANILTPRRKSNG